MPVVLPLIPNRAGCLLVAVVFAAPLAVPAQSYQQDAAGPTLVITKAGLDVGKSFLQNGDAEGAKYAVEFASKNFAAGLQALRAYDSETTDRIQLDLLNLPSAISGHPTSEAVLLVDSASFMMSGYDISEDRSDIGVVELLTAADDQYVHAIDQDNPTAYEISKVLFREAKAAFERTADLTVMKDLEQQSFFNDLERAVESKESFLTVGTLVGAIQRDLLGTETITHDQEALYDKVRALYAQLLEALDAGDYVAAEELAIEAYLDNFEYLEPTLEMADAEFMYALEIDMREDLRTMIQNRQDPQLIRDFLVGSILPDLDAGQEMTVEYLQSVADETATPFERGRGAPTGSQQAETYFIRATLQELLAHYERGDHNSAYAAARTAYLDSYEYVEMPLGPANSDFALEVESGFAELRNLIRQQADVAQVREVIAGLERNLDESERLTTTNGEAAPLIDAFASFAAVFGEGLGAVLILGAVMLYFEASRNSRLNPYVYYGMVAGVMAAGIMWVMASYVTEIFGADRQLIDMFVTLSAIGILICAMFCILDKIEHKRWTGFVRAKIWQWTAFGNVS